MLFSFLDCFSRKNEIIIAWFSLAKHKRKHKSSYSTVKTASMQAQVQEQAQKKGKNLFDQSKRGQPFGKICAYIRPHTLCIHFAIQERQWCMYKYTM